MSPSTWQNNQMDVHQRKAEPWRVTLVDTGEDTMTGGRLKRVAEHVADEEAFCFTYGDGVADVDIGALVALSSSSTASWPPSLRSSRRDATARWTRTATGVRGFAEKPRGDGGWINGGFFVLSPRCIDYIEGDDTTWEARAADAARRAKAS